MPIKNITWANIRNAFDRAGIRGSKDNVRDFVFELAENDSYNPIKEYLESLKWDGVPRVGTMFIDWFGVKDTSVNRKLTTKWLVSGVKRIYDQGCTIEGFPILIGKQGCGKSVFINRLGKGHVNESLTSLKDENKCAEACNMSWILHFDEVKALLKSDVETTKSFITRQADITRLAWREEPEAYQRHCIYFGSTNRIETGLLKDFSEGGEHERRFWLMQCSDDLDKRNIYDNFTDEIVDQLWAEAYEIYMKNPEYNISTSDFTAEEIEEVIQTQAEYKTYNNDDFKGVVEMILDREYSFCGVDNEFKDINDFIHQLKGDTFGDNKSKLDSIPMPWLHEALRMYDANRQTNYICSALRGQWKLVRRTSYRGQIYDCLKRVKTEV